MSITKRLREAGATASPFAAWKSEAERIDAGPVSLPTALPSSRTRLRPVGYAPPTPERFGQQSFFFAEV